MQSKLRKKGCIADEQKDSNVKRGYKQLKMPKGTTITWQNPSPFDEPYGSKLEDTDLFLKQNGLPLLSRPTLCQAITFQ